MMFWRCSGDVVLNSALADASSLEAASNWWRTRASRGLGSIGLLGIELIPDSKTSETDGIDMAVVSVPLWIGTLALLYVYTGKLVSIAEYASM